VGGFNIKGERFSSYQGKEPSRKASPRKNSPRRDHYELKGKHGYCRDPWRHYSRFRGRGAECKKVTTRGGTTLTFKESREKREYLKEKGSILPKRESWGGAGMGGCRLGKSKYQEKNLDLASPREGKGLWGRTLEGV